MKVLRIHEYGGPLQLEEMEKPAPGPNQVVVRNLGTSLNPIDPGRASGAMRRNFPLQFPWVPGGDVSGVVESAGEGVASLKPGDPVFGYNPPGGAYAEFVAVDVSALAARPPALTVEQAAAIAVVGQTAMQALELGELQSGKTVLIHAGAGGVGSLAIQLAHRAGARVITTAQASQRDTLMRLGADQVIDHTQEQFEKILQPVDLVLDLVGGDTLARSYGIVKPGGIIVTANQPPDPAQCQQRQIRGLMVQTKVTTQGLNDFAARVSAGQVIPLIAGTETLWNPQGIWKKRPSGKAVGKIVFTLSPA